MPQIAPYFAEEERKKAEMGLSDIHSFDIDLQMDIEADLDGATRFPFLSPHPHFVCLCWLPWGAAARLWS